MTVPVADQRRLIHILADDLQPRIDWAYNLEQELLAIGAGFITFGNGDPNGLVTAEKGDLRIDVTTPAVWQNQNGGTVWTNISAGGGSGLPDPWTANQTSGEVTARTDGTDATALTVAAVIGQTEPQLVVKDENGSNTLEARANGDFVIPLLQDNSGRNLSLGDAGSDLVFASFDAQHDTPGNNGGGTGGIGLFSRTNDSGCTADLSADASTVGDNGAAQSRMQGSAGVAGGDISQFDFVAALDKARVRVRPVAGQTDGAFDVVAPADGSTVLFRVSALGAIGTSAGEPADAAINDGEMFLYFDPTNGASAVKFKGKSLDGTVVTSSGPMT